MQFDSTSHAQDCARVSHTGNRSAEQQAFIKKARHGHEGDRQAGQMGIASVRARVSATSRADIESNVKTAVPWPTHVGPDRAPAHDPGAPVLFPVRSLRGRRRRARRENLPSFETMREVASGWPRADVARARRAPTRATARDTCQPSERVPDRRFSASRTYTLAVHILGGDPPPGRSEQHGTHPGETEVAAQMADHQIADASCQRTGRSDTQ